MKNSIMPGLKLLCLAGICLIPLGAQTKVNLAHQTSNADFSAAQSTKPVKVVTGLPAACSVGEMVFKSDAPAGHNLYTCTAANFWSLQLLADFDVKRIGNTELAIGPGCSAAKPCNFRLGSSVAALSTPATVSITSAASTSNAFIYIDERNILVVGHGAGLTLSCSPGCEVVSGITAFPADSLPLARWGATTTVGQWDSIGELRAASAHHDLIKAGDGLVASMDLFGVKSISVDSAQVPRYLTGSGVPAGACQTGRDYYLNTANADLYKCNAGIWIVQGGGSAAPGGSPACDVTSRFTFWSTAGSTGIKDSVEVCAKDAAGNYAWRTLY